MERPPAPYYAAAQVRCLGILARTRTRIDNNDPNDGVSQLRHAGRGLKELGEESNGRDKPEQDGEQLRKAFDKA